MRHTKKLLLIVFTIALTLGLASQALADPTPTPTSTTAPQTFTCLGKVSAASSSGLTITVRHASCALQGSLGAPLTLTATDTSVLSLISHGTKTPVAAADVPVGDLLVASGTIDVSSDPGTTLYDITKACVWAPRTESRFLCLGTVSSVDPQTSANSLVVCVARGSLGLHGFICKDVTIDVPASARIFCLQRRLATTTTFDQITAGDRVWITGVADRSDPSAPVFTARRVLVHHVVPVSQLKWFACCGQVSGPGTSPDTLLVTVACGTRAVRSDIGGQLTITATPGSVIRTLSDGVVTTLPVADVTAGESILVSGTIDHSVPTSPVYDIGHAFVWQPAANS
jgi:hypothetical protein